MQHCREGASPRGVTMANGRRLYRDIVDKMLGLIDSGKYPVGGRLPPERELAEMFEVSRPTIREAIIALEVLERVTVKTGSGVYVIEHPELGGNAYQNISPFELTEARALIEGEAASLAAKLITQEELESLEQSLKGIARENECGDLVGGDADRSFHHQIALATRNNMIMLITDQLWHVRDNAPQVYKAYKSICVENEDKRFEEHREVYEALVARDPDAARAAMRQHFARILNKMITTTEAEQFEEIKRRSEEVRQRYSLDHLLSGN